MSLTQWCFQKEQAAPKRGGRPRAELEDDLARGKAILCARCAFRITRAAFRIEMGGSHTHTRVNPHGFQFTFGCFARAEGCLTRGRPSSEHTWFSGYTWQIEDCQRCGTHLGWLFESGDHVFHGLVLDRLVEGEDDEERL